MPYEFIQIPANGQGNAKDALNQLLQAGRIASVRKEFVANGEDSFWAFCVEHLESAAGGPKGRTGTAPKVDYKERLSAEDFAVFAKLRELRKEFAEKEAVPTYAIFTNEQLAAIDKNWALAIGLQPCTTGRQLEQQRQQLPGGKPQQQQPEQLKQQQRVPGRPQLRLGLQPDRAVVSMGLNRSVPSSRRIHRRDEVLNAPLGVSSTVDAVSKAPSGDSSKL